MSDKIIKGLSHGDVIPKFLKGSGIEIGAHESPIPGISPILVDKFEVYVGQPCKADYFGDSVNLPFHDNSLDYVASSHVLEHSANPTKALIEWYRVLRPGGIIYLIVPNKQHTFDRPRKTTSVKHLLEDYFNDTNDKDPSHIDDFCFGIDWTVIDPNTPKSEINKEREKHANFYRNELINDREINLHFHVFEPDQLVHYIKSINEHKQIPITLEPVLFADRFPKELGNGVLAVLRKPGTENIITRAARKIRSKFSRYPATNDAIPFPYKGTDNR
ncbi:class I SAM-dependent methyltransferase [Pelagicoccus enzymogenes]|uniref:class I SAM-dependent methyltransferase n=1 Tax=Pelagicoccus enzymogenes TaxID=2773457 RepID=UPI00280F2ADE|nr:class I SAM-dependent methyltransferase [Pelagicoccus enzymogenes]MDQ8197552.1 class I SAM-dependent methyltransferase [Pelagicoccus enzymogenes]